MKKYLKCILSLVLCLCMCVSLVPALPVLAAVNTAFTGVSTTTEELENVGQLSSLSNFTGAVLQYNKLDNGKIRIDVGYYNTQQFNTSKLNFRFDTTKVKFLKADETDFVLGMTGNVSTEDKENAIKAAEISDDILTQMGKDGFAAEPKQKNMFGSYGPMSYAATSSFIDTASKAMTGDLQFVIDSKDDEGLDEIFLNVTRSETGTVNLVESYPKNQIMNVFSMYFQELDTKNPAVYGTFAVCADKSAPTGFYTGTGSAVLDTGVALVGFPPAPEPSKDVTFTIKGKYTDENGDAKTIALPNAVLNFSGKSNRDGVSIGGDYITAENRTTGTDGTKTVNLPYSDANKYTFTVDNVTVDGRTFTMGAHPESFEVSANSTATITYDGMQELKAAFPFAVQAVDQNGEAVSLKGATLNFGSKTETGIADEAAAITISEDGDQTVTLSGVQGYQIASGTVKVTPDKTDYTTKATLSTTADGFAVDEAGTTLTITLKPVETKVTMEIPVPTDEDGTNISTDKANEMRVTFRRVGISRAGGSASDDIAAVVTVNDTNTDSITDSIVAEASLPDGEYTVVISGAGIAAKETKASVATTYTDAGKSTPIVNIGGTLAEGEDGNITATGGATAVGGKLDEGTGNSTMNLTAGGADATGTTITDAGAEGTVTLTSSTGETTTSGEEINDITAAGILGSATVKAALTADTVTDPIYEVKTVAHKNDAGDAVDYVDVTISLKNINASSGTFGMYYDPEIFDGTNLTAADIKFNEAASIIEGTSLPKEAYYDANVGYIFFGWQVDYTAAGNTELKGKEGTVEIATVQIPVKQGEQLLSKLKTKMDDRSIYTMDFAGTTKGKDIIDKANASGDEAVLNNTLGAIWRPVEMAGTTDAQKLDESLATRGGFYQVSAAHPDLGVNVNYDIMMEFIPDPLVERSRADFYVTEPATGKPVYNAKVEIYDEPYDPENPPAVVATAYTNTLGYADAALVDGQYYYRVTEDSHWAYPDGTSKTDDDGLHYGGFTLEEGVLTPTENVFPDGEDKYKLTPVVDEYLTPQMAPKTFHMVELVAAEGELNAVFSGDEKARNGVDYYFTLTPADGYEWSKSMDEIAAALTESVKFYEVNPEATDLTGAFRTDLSDDALTITWDAAHEQFKISGAEITGESINKDKIGDVDVEPLRAGDIVLTLSEDELAHADYVITATAGEGGTVSWAADESLDPDNGDGNTDLPGTGENAPVIENTNEITETISGGRTTSGNFTFAPTDDAKYDFNSVIVNGVELPLTKEQKKAATFTYQFTNVNADQNIYVTFVDVSDPENPVPVSQAQVEVIVGANGSAEVTVDDAEEAETVAASSTGIFYVDENGKVVIEAVPGDPIEGKNIVVDTVMVNGVDVTATLENNTVTLENIEAASSHTVAITFKPEGEDSTHVIVTASINKGFGTLAPFGQKIYPVGNTPVYTMTPDPGWTVAGPGAIVVNGVAETDAEKLKSEGGVYTYTMSPVLTNTTLVVTFTEVTQSVEGLIQLVDSTPSVVAEASITFVRAANSDTQTDEETIPVQSGTNVTAKVIGDESVRVVQFNKELPAGTWDVIVTKQGYLSYTIKGFVVVATEDPDDVTYFGATDNTSATMRPIPLTPGDAAGEGIAIAFNDASIVVAGWLKDALPANQLKGNIDEYNAAGQAGSDTTDIGYVADNMYETRTTNKAYDAFCQGQ